MTIVRRFDVILKSRVSKTGEGRLALSGINSYEGTTRVVQGELELTNSGKLTQSNAYAERSGIFVPTGGEISHNAYAINGSTITLNVSSTSSSILTTDKVGGILLGQGSISNANKKN